MQKWVKWTLIFIAIFFIIIVPYSIMGSSIENWVNQFLNSSNSILLIGIVIGGLLSVDILLPVPSSIMSTAGGYFLGLIPGTLISLGGMTISCIIGYYLGSKFGNPISKRWVGSKELLRLHKLENKYGDWIIIISRAVPFLAEASVFVAGIGRMPLKRFILLISLSNLGISLVYSFIGAYSAHLNSFLVAFVGAIVFPALAIVFLKFKS